MYVSGSACGWSGLQPTAPRQQRLIACGEEKQEAPWTDVTVTPLRETGQLCCTLPIGLWNQTDLFRLRNLIKKWPDHFLSFYYETVNCIEPALHAGSHPSLYLTSRDRSVSEPRSRLAQRTLPFRGSVRAQGSTAVPPGSLPSIPLV